MQEVINELRKIVGDVFVSDAAEERFIYSRDQGTMEPRFPDVVVMPGSVEQVQDIMRLATRSKTPVVPMGGGLVLSGLTRPLKGGIVMDLKRMNRILEINPTSRYALVEAGCAQGMLQSYLAKHHPNLKHSMPDAPPIATVAGNVLIHGSGHMSAWAGFHTDQLNGIEAVLPTGEVVRLGSCSTSDYWFARAPLPDLSGLFLGWAGTTGVVTKLAIKLFPKKAFQDVRIFVIDNPDYGTDVINRLADAGVAEDMSAWMTPKPDWANGLLHFNIIYSADDKEELAFKREILSRAVKPYIADKTGGFMALPYAMKKSFMAEPAATLAKFADVKKGGGFEYVGAIMPVGNFAKAYELGLEQAAKHNVAYSLGARVIGQAHSMMFFYAYAFNRAEDQDVANAQHALEATNEAVLKLGGVPWKAEAPAQKQIIEHMHPETYALMKKLRSVLDPSAIMNPGNWEVGQ